MKRARLAPLLIAVIALLATISTPAGAATTTTAITPPKSYILIDNDTGKVLQASNEHSPLPPASITKLLTALVSINQLPENKLVPISPDAATMPAMRIGVQPSQMWNRDDLLRSLLMVSANDAAVALADASAGSLANFSTMRYTAARELGLADNPTLNDPAGLDDSTFSNDGGDRISARDMAIIGRAALANPLIASIADTKQYNFVGPDGAHHELPNHNKMLSQYDGAIGLKTGYTAKAMNTFVGAAKRDGRTMLVVVMGADNPYNYSEQLLNQGFATPVAAEPIAADVLPLHSLNNLSAPSSAAAVPMAAVKAAPVSHHRLAVETTMGLIALLGVAAVAMRKREVA